VTKKINQRKIAQNLQLSAATVSRSLRNHPDITPQTRARVIEEAGRLGYDVGRSGGAMATSDTVGVLIAGGSSADVRHQIYSMMTAGISSAAAAHHATAVVHYVNGDGSELLDPDGVPPFLQPGRSSGLILMNRFNKDVLHGLANRLPCVTLSHYVYTATADHVASDHVHAFAVLVDHLYALGHRQIGFINRTPTSSITRERFAAYIQSLQRLDLTLSEEHQLVLPLTGTEDAQQAMIQHLIKKIRSGTRAWMCDSDGTAYRVLRSLKDHGVAVPGEVSITGYDRLEPLYGCPQLTTVQVPFQEMGATALRQVLARVQHPQMLYRQTLVRCEFIAGQTAGPAV